MTIPWLRLSTRVAHFLGVTLPEETDFHVGVEAWGRGDYDRALQEFRPLAEQGHAQAQVNLGILYSQGRGVPKDSVQGYVWSYGQKTHTGKAKAKLALLTLWERQLVIRHVHPAVSPLLAHGLNFHHPPCTLSPFLYPILLKDPIISNQGQA